MSQMGMELGTFGVGDRHPNADTGRTVTEHERITSIARIAKHAEDVGLDVYALGEHHNPPFIPSSPTTILGYVAAKTERIILSTSTTLITTDDPVKIAEDYSTLQHLAEGRVDLMLGRGNTAEVYPWFGQDIRSGIELAVENYALLRRLWDEEVVDWEGRFRTPLRGFIATPRPLDGIPPFVWHGSIRSPEIAEQAAYYGDGFFVNNLFMSRDYFKRYIDYYRDRYEHHRTAGQHSGPEGGIVGAGGAIYVRPRSQDAWREFRPVYENHPILSSSGSLDDAVARTGLNVGSPAEIVEQVLAQRDLFGDYQRQMFAIDMAGISEPTVHEELDLIGTDVLPVLRRELEDHLPMTTPKRHDAAMEPLDDAIDHIRGSAAGRLILEYGDYECPYSRRAFQEIERVERQVGDEVRFAFRHFPLTEIHPHALAAAAAAEAGALQGRFWDMHGLLFHRQSALENDDLRRYAAELGLDAVRFDSDRTGPAVLRRVARDAESAIASGEVQGTPTLFIDGVVYRGDYDVAALLEALAR